VPANKRGVESVTQRSVLEIEEQPVYFDHVPPHPNSSFTIINMDFIFQNHLCKNTYKSKENFIKRLKKGKAAAKEKF